MSLHKSMQVLIGFRNTTFNDCVLGYQIINTLVGILLLHRKELGLLSRFNQLIHNLIFYCQVLLQIFNLGKN